MQTRDVRRFRIADILVLVACAGISFELMRFTTQYNAMVASSRRGPLETPLFANLVWIQWTLGHALIGLGVAQIVLRFLRPRPAIRLAVRQAGFQASAAAVFACLFKASFKSWTYSFYSRPPRPRLSLQKWSGLIFVDDPETVVPVIAAAWLSLVICGRWRPAADWVDSLGRWVGWCWFLKAPIFLAHRFLL